LNNKQIALLFFITLIPFFIFSIGRFDFVGADTYYFLNHVCGEGELNELDLTRTFFDFLPCNFIVLKTMLFFLCFSCVFSIALVGEFFNKKNGWMAGLWLFLSPIFFLEFTKLENDQIAYPFLFLAIYFFYKGFFKNRFCNRLIAVVLVLFATQFWGGSVFFLMAFAFGSLLFALASIPLLVLFWQKLFFTVLPRFPTFEWIVWENSLIGGIAYVFLLLLGYNGINWFLLPQLVFFTALFLLNSKFVFLVVPFLALGFVNYFEKLDKAKYGVLFKQVFLWLPFFLAVSWGLVSLQQPPQPYHWSAVEFALDASSRPSIVNDWDFGYWVLFKGGRTEQFGAPKDFNASGIVLTRKQLDCNLLKQFNDLRVYKC